jgi:hypothetical protein
MTIGEPLPLVQFGFTAETDPAEIVAVLQREYESTEASPSRAAAG